MKFLKGLAVSLLSFLLFLSLSVFGSMFMLNNTILNPDFVVSELNRLDIPSLAKEFLGKQIPQGGEFMVEVLDDTITDLEPWIKEQVSSGVYSGYDYLMGRSESLSLVIPLEPVKDSLKENLREAILKSPPPELKGLPPAVMEQAFNESFEQFTKDIPSKFEFSESSLSPEVLAQLEQVRQGIGYSQTVYKGLIGFMLLLILGIILINRNIRATTRGLGTTSLIDGVLGYLGIFAAKYFAGAQLPQLEIPLWLQDWIPQFMNNLLAPLEMFCIGLMAAGVVLLIVSFVYKPRQPSL